MIMMIHQIMTHVVAEIVRKKSEEDAVRKKNLIVITKNIEISATMDVLKKI
jgi:hypothetical protein